MNYDQEYYNYHVQPLGFSEKAMNEAEGKFRPAFYQIKTEEIGVARISVAWIPDSDRAEYELLQWLRPRIITAASKQNKAKSTETECPSEAYFSQGEIVEDEDGTCGQFYDVVVTDGPGNNTDGGGSGENGPDWNWPNDPYDPGAGGGGGPNNDNPECNPPDYCEEPEDDFCEINPTADVCLDEAPEGIPQDYYDTLNDEEKRICLEDVSKCIGVYHAQNYAFNWSKSKEPNGTGHNDAQDALRHAMWNAKMAYAFGREYAKRWGDAHELNPSQPNCEKQMDLFNNQIGRDLGHDAGRNLEHWPNVEQAILDALTNGELQIFPVGC